MHLHVLLVGLAHEREASLAAMAERPEERSRGADDRTLQCPRGGLRAFRREEGDSRAARASSALASLPRASRALFLFPPDARTGRVSRGTTGMDFRKTFGGRLPALVALLGATTAGSVISPGCTELDTTPPAITQGTLGEEIVQVFCERMAREADPSDVSGLRWKPVCEGRAEPPADAPPRLVALHANRARLVDALDRALPEPMQDELGAFLGALLPFFDRPEERLPAMTRRTADFLMRLARDDEAIAALERIGTREGYRPLRLALGLARPIMAYPELDEFTERALHTLLEGPAQEAFTELQRAAALEMATIEPTTSDSSERSTLELIRELMFTEDELFAVGPPTHVLLRDVRGLAQPALGSDGTLPAPFVDLDGDGLADVDALGRFIDAQGERLAVPAPFRVRHESGVPRDSAFRALRPDGTRYYEYIDASRTMLAGATAELAPWLTPESPTLMQLSRGLPLLMGGTTPAARNYGAHTLGYKAFATANGSLFDVVHALGEMLHRPGTDDALAVAEALLREHESATAGLIRAARYLANQGDLHPDAKLTAPSTFWDDLIDLVIRIAQKPGMLEAVMRSFSDPRSEQLGEIYGGLMRYRDRITFDPNGVNRPPIGFPLDQPVDRTKDDTFDNESLFQRTLALIDGLNGVRVCNRAGAVMRLEIRGIPVRWPLFGTADECELIDIPNVAEAYALAILGEYELELQSSFLRWVTENAGDLLALDEAIERASGIEGMTRRPTPQALNRLVFWGLSDASGTRSCTPNENGGDCNSAFAGQLFAPVRDRHGNLVIERYHGTIFAWEMPGFYEGMSPLLEVLHQPGWDRDEEGRYMFGELLGTLHRHWASPRNTETCGNRSNSRHTCEPGEPNFSHQSNVRSYEPLVAEGFIEGKLIERLHRLNLALETIRVRPGVDGVAALADATAELVDPRQNVGLTNRRGETTTQVNDGSRTVPLTPLYLLLDALNAMDRDLETDLERLREWRKARQQIAEQFLATTTLGQEFRFGNRRAHAILSTVLPFARERIAEHRAAGDLEEWATTLHSRLEETMREPLMSALIRFLDAVNEDPEARASLARLLGYLVTVASENDAFPSTIHAAADLLMVMEDERNIVPLLRALSEAMAPNVREVIASGGELDIEGSAVRDALRLMRDIGEVDRERTLPALLQNAVALPSEGEPITPLETILDVLAEVNRAEPNAGGTLRADDYRSVLGHVTDFILDEDRGLERLTAVVQERQCFPEEGNACNAAGDRIESRGQCYEGAMCICTEEEGALAWRCAP